MWRAAIIVGAAACWPGTTAAQEALKDEAVREKSERIGDQLEELLEGMGARRGDELEAKPAPLPDLDDAPIAGTASVSEGPTDAVTAGYVAILRTAFGREPTGREVALFAGAHPDLTADEAVDFASVPGRLADAATAQERLAAYEAHSAHAYCDLLPLVGADPLDEAFMNDPVLGARCGQGGPLVMRRSAWNAARWQMDFAAALIGAPPLSEADATKLMAQIPAYIATGEIDRVRFWTDAGSLSAKAQAEWAILSATPGRARQAEVIRQVRTAPADAVSRSSAFRSAVHRQHALADFEAFLAANDEVSRAVTKGVLEQSCVWGAAIAC